MGGSRGWGRSISVNCTHLHRRLPGILNSSWTQPWMRIQSFLKGMSNRKCLNWEKINTQVIVERSDIEAEKNGLRLTGCSSWIVEREPLWGKELEVMHEPFHIVRTGYCTI